MSLFSASTFRTQRHKTTYGIICSAKHITAQTVAFPTLMHALFSKNVCNLQQFATTVFENSLHAHGDIHKRTTLKYLHTDCHREEAILNLAMCLQHPETFIARIYACRERDYNIRVRYFADWLLRMILRICRYGYKIIIPLWSVFKNLPHFVLDRLNLAQIITQQQIDEVFICVNNKLNKLSCLRRKQNK